MSLSSTEWMALIKVMCVLFLIAVLSLCVVLARRSSPGTRAALGGMLMLFFGGAAVPPRETQTIEEVKEDKGKKGAESGDPPSR